MKDLINKILGRLFPPETVEIRADEKYFTPEEYAAMPQNLSKNPQVEKPVMKMAEADTPEDTGLLGFLPDDPDKDLMDLILGSSKKHEIDPALLAAVLYQESRFNPRAVGDTDPNDIGIAQINLPSHPDVSREQAMDPRFAVDYAAKLLSGNINKFGDINRGVAAYNVGPGGANVQGPEPFGGGPRGQTYLDNVARNLSPELRKKLGLTTTY